MNRVYYQLILSNYLSYLNTSVSCKNLLYVHENQQCDKILRHFLTLAKFILLIFRVGLYLATFWAYFGSFMIGIWHMFTVIKGQILKNDLAIWSHWSPVEWIESMLWTTFRWLRHNWRKIILNFISNHFAWQA